MADLTNLVSKVRLELADQPRQFTKTFVGDGTTKSFTLGVKPIDINTLMVTVNGTVKAITTGYTVEVVYGVVHLVTAPAAGQSIVVSGNVFRYFTDEDLTGFVNTAVTQHTYNRVDAFGSNVTINTLPAVEDYPLTILATIEALWSLATDASFDIDITAPDGVHIPRSERYRQLTNTIQARWDQYHQLCAALNIGLWKMEVGTLIRTSRTTNKFVPIYMGQEIDDARRPERVYIQNNLLGRTPMPTTAQLYDIILYQGDSWSAEFDFPFDVTGLVFKAQIRSYPNSPSLYGTFTINVLATSENLSRVQLVLTKSDTAYLPVRAFWDLQATAPGDDNYEETYIRGQVFTTQEVTLD